MRWKTPKESKPLYNIKKWFAITPITIGDETRWMEWVEVEYESVMIYGVVPDSGKIIERPKRFVN
jgi:hypothetical protein